VRPYRGNGRPEAAFVIERMVDEAAAELDIDPIELRRRNMIRRGDAVQDRADLTYDFPESSPITRPGARRRRLRGFRSAPGRGEDPWQTAGYRRLEHNRARRRAKLRRCRGAFRPQRHSNPGIGLDHAGQGHETVYKHCCATGSVSTPIRCTTCRATPRRCRFAEGTGGSRSATLVVRGLSRDEKSSPRPRRLPPYARRRCRGSLV